MLARLNTIWLILGSIDALKVLTGEVQTALQTKIKRNA